MKENILIIDDENDLRKLLVKLIRLEGYNTFDSENALSGLEILSNEEIALVLTDVKLPDINGIELIQKIKSINPLCEIIVITAYGTIDDGVRAIKEGAFDYITKGDEENKIIPLINNAVEKVNLRKRIASLEKSIINKFNFDSILGSSEEINIAKLIASKVARTDTPVLLLGPTGTGKELFAQAIHYSSNRSKNQFLAINCSALSKELLESEMFGYKAGAFTGAVKDKKGLFEEANSGTLFLDEIGELDLSLQAKFLRVLETSDFIKPGDTKLTKVNVRIIAATNRNLIDEIEKGNFRSDLYYRISVLKIELPSLNNRKEDIKEISEFYISHFSKKMGKNIQSISKSFWEHLYKYNFPGNIRELKNVIERAIILLDGEILSEKSLPNEFFNEKVNHTDDVTILEDVEKNHIIKILNKENGNKTKTAEILGIGLTTLYRKLQLYNIE